MGGAISGELELIKQIVLESNSSTFELTDLELADGKYLLVIQLSTTANGNQLLRFNDDNSGNYAYRRELLEGVASGISGVNATSILYGATTDASLGNFQFEMLIEKRLQGGGWALRGQGAESRQASIAVTPKGNYVSSAKWGSGDTITKISQVGYTYLAGSRMTLYKFRSID